MLLKLHESIKRLRKEKGMTQEKLAEVLGVTVGAVSKWENGNNTPDIVTLMMLADFFEVSVDVLLGYDISSKKVKDIVERINAFTLEHRFDEAESCAAEAMTRYPHNFTVIYSAAMMFHVKAVELKCVASAKESIRLFEKAKDYFSQNEDHNINEYSINNIIATDYLLFDEKKALDIFKKNNYSGINNPIISFIYLEKADVKESMNYSSNALVMNIFGVVTSSTYMVLALTCTGKKEKINSALDLADTTIRLIKLYTAEEIGYFSKYAALFYVMEAYIYALLQDEEMMNKCVDIGKQLAVEYDRLDSEDVSKNMRFYYADKAIMAIDSIGKSAVNGIAELLFGRFINIPGMDKNKINKIKDIWIKMN